MGMSGEIVKMSDEEPMVRRTLWRPVLLMACQTDENGLAQ